jgi:hypothetical protein
MKSRGLGLVVGSSAALAALFAARAAHAVTYEVGPGKPVREISAVTAKLKPGDVVEVQGGATYGPIELESHGTAAAPITLRGIRVNGKRPVIQGGDNTVLVSANYTVLEGFEITGGSGVCLVHHSHGNVFRDDVVHGCPRHGILGTDADSGSLTMEYVEVYDAGSEPSGESLKHPVYIATDEKAHPGSVFRMQHCYVHDGNGGNSVKSRAERSEIYGNWLEGGQYYELELIGPDDDSGDQLAPPREDGDIVGNVFFQTVSESYVVRIGGDGTGRTGGRYRFVNNTFVHGGNQGNDGTVRLSYALESVEFYNNVVYSPSRTIEYLMRETELGWVNGRSIVGTNNWISQDAQDVPQELAGTILGADPGFSDFAKRDVRLKETSPLIDKGAAVTSRADAYALPNPLAKPTHTPPLRVLPAVGAASQRASVGVMDIGAFEYGSVTEEPGVLTDGGGGGAGGGGRARDAAGGGGAGDGDESGDAASGGDLSGGCACSTRGASASGGAYASGVALAALIARRASRRRRARERAGARD